MGRVPDTHCSSIITRLIAIKTVAHVLPCPNKVGRQVHCYRLVLDLLFYLESKRPAEKNAMVDAAYWYNKDNDFTKTYAMPRLLLNQIRPERK